MRNLVRVCAPVAALGIALGCTTNVVIEGKPPAPTPPEDPPSEPVNRTTVEPTADAGAPDDSGGGDAGADADAGPSHDELFVGICVLSLAGRESKQALRFYTVVTFGADAIAMRARPMVTYDVEGNTPIVPATVSSSLARGDEVSASSPGTTASKEHTLSFGTLELPAETNAVSGRDATIEGFTVTGKFLSSGRFCGTMGGTQTEPYTLVFDPEKNTCLFVPAFADGAPMPTVVDADFFCEEPDAG